MERERVGREAKELPSEQTRHVQEVGHIDMVYSVSANGSTLLWPFVTVASVPSYLVLVTGLSAGPV